MPGVVTDEDDWKGLWQEENLYYHAAGPMTAREFMQYFGTEVMRKMYEPIWVNSCIKKYKENNQHWQLLQTFASLTRRKLLNKPVARL